MTKNNKKSILNFVMVMCFAVLTLFTLTACGKKEHKHEMEHIDAISATCTVGGNIEYWHCKTCDKNFDKEKDGKEIQETKIAPLGHDYCNYYDASSKTYCQICTRNTEHKIENIEAGKDELFPIIVSSIDDIHSYSLKTNENETIYLSLNDDIETSSHLGIGRNLVLDLNGNTLSYETTKNNDSFIFAGIGDANDKPFVATIRNGKIVYRCENKDTGGNMIQASNKSTLILDNIVGTSSHTGISVFDNTNVKIKDCNIQASDFALASNNGLGGENLKVEVENSNLSSTKDAAIFVPNYMVLSITQNSIILGKSAALHILMGDITVEDSKLLAINTTFSERKNKDEITKQGASLDDRTSEGAAVVVRSNLYYDNIVKTNNIKLNFKNVHIDSATDVDVVIYKCNDASGSLVKADAKTVINQDDVVVNYFLGLNLNTRIYNYENGTVNLVDNNQNK